MFKSEQKCRELLQLLTGLRFEKIRFKEFVNPQTGYLLELDGYCEELLLAFEFQGKQHYEFIPYFHNNDYEKFERQQYRDDIKKSYCKQYGITLLEIPYTMNTDKKKLDFIVDFLENNNISYILPSPVIEQELQFDINDDEDQDDACYDEQDAVQYDDYDQEYVNQILDYDSDNEEQIEEQNEEN